MMLKEKEEVAPMLLPQARTDQLVVEEVFDELVVYDLKRNQVHSLNSTAALVWQHCDGRTTYADVITLLQRKLDVPPEEELLRYTLERLQKAHLLESKVMAANPIYGDRITRRQALRTMGVAVALLPVVTSIVAPRAAQAQSSDSSECDSGQCHCLKIKIEQDGSETVLRDYGCLHESRCAPYENRRIKRVCL
jgi:hypothetical protein